MEKKGVDKSGKILAIAAVIAILLIVLVSFALAYAGRDITLLSERTLHLSVNGQITEISLKEDEKTYNLPALTTEQDNEFILLNDAGASIDINGSSLQTGKKTKLSVKKIGSNELLTLTANNGKDIKTLYLRTLSTELPVIQATGEEANGLSFCVTVKDAPIIYKLNSEGQITWYTALNKKNIGGKIFKNFRQHLLPDGNIRYSYQIVEPEIDTYGISDYYPGTRIVLNDKYEEVKIDGARVTILDSKVEKLDKKVGGHPIDGKDFVVLGDNHYLVMGTELVSSTNIPAHLNPSSSAKVAEAIVQEIKDYKIVFEWKSTSSPQLFELSEMGNQFSTSEIQDYLHINSIAVDPTDDNVVVALENANALVKINREDGKVKWIMSGKGDNFALTEEKKFNAPTNLSINIDGKYTLTERGSGRTISFKIDSVQKNIEKFVVEQAPQGFSETNVDSVFKANDYEGRICTGVKDGKSTLTYTDKTGKVLMEVVYPNGEKMDYVSPSVLKK